MIIIVKMPKFTKCASCYIVIIFGAFGLLTWNKDLLRDESSLVGNTELVWDQLQEVPFVVHLQHQVKSSLMA